MQAREKRQVVPRGYAQSESLTSMQLQLLLQLNAVLSLIAVVVEVPVLYHKLTVYELDVFGRVMAPLCFGLWGTTELIRLWIGQTGNLREQLPQMSVFVMISIFPQLPCLLYLTQLQFMQMPMESALGGLLLAILIAEIVVGLGAARKLMGKQRQSYVRLVELLEKEDAKPI